MRRKDREVTGIENITAILDRCEYLHLGLSSGNKPYIVPMNFGYENNGGIITIYLHGAKEGKKHDIIAVNGNACFEVVCSYKTLEADEACKWSAAYQSVIGEGIIAAVNGIEAKTKGLDCIMKHCGFKGKPDYPRHAMDAVTVLKIEVSSITGKQHLK
jgi:nitroimidazol reductase NimA-like FMN-containing flavoprotein (pyridoxamine 5'-phosphate oxidase superfamily)